MKLSWRVALCYVWFIVALPLGSYATHLMGGNLTYQFLGLNTSTGEYEYTVTLNLYRYCATGSSNLPADMNIGLYQDNPGNPTGDKLQVLNTSLSLISSQFIVPPNPNDSCTFVPNVCVEEGIYQTVISVPDSTSSYYLISDRCCRNNNIANLDNPQDVGQAYFAYLPPATIINNSPTFAVAPVPFICANDTVSILNQANDLDGDSLVYSFVTPYGGVSSNMNPNPNPPNIYPWPIPDVIYATGYSLASPFGAGGYTGIDQTSGLTTYLAQNQGFYVVAIEIREYRNGVLIGITRRDLQIIVITCPANPAPNLAAGGTQTNYTIQEGQTLCFNVSFSDSNGDSLFITHTGDIFNSILTNPPATLANASGLASASSQFCWTTSCSQGRANPYQFSAIATDNGCPAKTTNVVYTINVINTAKPTTIFGPDTLCYNSATGISYLVSGTPGYSYNWFVDNGSQLSGGTTSSISVGFTATGNVSVAVIAVNPYGCGSDTLRKNVFIKSLPSAIAGNDINFCSGGSAVIGTNSTAGYTYSWSPATGLSSTTVANPTVTLNNPGTTPLSFDYIVTSTFDGCSNTDTITITANPFPVANAGNNVTICSGSSVPLGSLPTTGYTYTWDPISGLSNSSVANPVLTLTNLTNQPDTLYYYLVVENSFLCVDSDTVQVVVRPVPSANAGTDLSFCSGQSGVIGAASTTGYTYNWSPTSGLSTPTTSTTGVTLSNATTVNDTVSFILTTLWFGCTDNDTVNVIVRPNPVSNAGNNQLLCSGNTVQLGTINTAGYTYSWNPSTGLSNDAVSNPTLTLSNTTSIPDTLFYIVTTTLNGCVTEDTVQVISSPIPTALAGSDVTFCSGQTVTVGTPAVGGYTYTWSPAGGLSSISSANPNLTLTNSTGIIDTVQYIMAVNWFGCIDRDTILAFVKPLPVSNAGANASLCSGDTITLGTATTVGYTYSWNPTTGLSSSTISDPTLVVNNPGPGITTIDYAVTSTLSGCVTSDTVTLTINPLPVVTGTVSPIIICVGTSATLTGTGANTYDWALLSAPGVSIGTGTTLTVSPLLSTTYIVTGTSTATCVNTDTVTLQVNQLPNVQLTTAIDSVCEGDTIVLIGNGAANYTYTAIGTPGVLGTGPSISVAMTTTTTFVLTGTDANLCANTDTITVRVNPAATVNGITGTLSLCPGVTGVPYWVNNPNSTSTYSWTIGNGTLSGGQGTDTAFVDWDSSGVGSITVIETTDRGCESDPVILPVNINVILTPQAPTGPTILCANQAQGINYSLLNTPSSTYNWVAQGGTIVSGNGTSSVLVDWTVTGPATVALWYEETSVTVDTVCFGVSDTIFVTINPIPVTSAIQGTGSICVFDTAQYNVNNAGGSTFNWTIVGGTILSGQNSNIISVAWSASGSNTVTVQETNSFNCTGNPVNLTVTVNALPNVLAGSDATICFGDSTQLNASGGISYEWNPITSLDNSTIANPFASPTVNTTYIVLGTDANGCKNTASVDVIVNSLPVVDAGISTAICIGSDTILNVTGGSSWLWSPASSLSNPTSSNPVASPTITTMYTVVATDGNGCSSTDSVQITVNSLPVADAGLDQLTCSGSGLQLNATGGISYLWSPSTGLNNATIQNPIATLTGAQQYTVTVTDANGCQDDDQVDISVNDQPVADFTIDTTASTVGCNGVTVVLVNSSTNALNYLWNLGDGTSSTDPNVTHLYPFAQQGTITLIAYNNLCSDTLDVPLELKSLNDYLKNLTNVFTPNGDGINDCLDLGSQSNFEECSSWKVFNRWGKKVFQSNSTYSCWNGKQDNSGDLLPEGVYFYILDIGNTQHKGTVQLIR